MIALSPPSITFCADDVAKQKAANKQMSDLLQRVANGQMHRTLTSADRKLLENEGYAPDLVNNLVYLTQRFQGGGLSEYTDKLITGFTDAAIDPSIYATPAIRKALQANNKGNCAFCESHLLATDAGYIYHFRPASILMEKRGTVRSPYYNLAYTPDNLFYACRACCENHKQSQFPLEGKRYPQVPLDEEMPLLINPYKDMPDKFIGFSPLTAFAYPLDLLEDFFFDTQSMPKNEVKPFLLANPECIHSLSDSPHRHANLDEYNAFVSWLSKKSPSQYKGVQTIQMFGLNRQALLFQRFSSLMNWYISFQAGERSEFSCQYQALYNDARESWLSSQKTAESTSIKWESIYKENPYSAVPDAKYEHIPNWLRSRLIYFVRESELTISGKRRIVYLGAEDFLYGADNPEKSIFLSIDWNKDINNTLKVRNKKLTWETSFSDLANSHPLEISKLFAQNEIWAEGNYKALA